MKSKCLLAAAVSAVALTMSGCHYDEPFHPHHRGAYHGSYYGRSSHDGYSSRRYSRDYYDDHRAAEHDDHDNYDHDY